MDFLIKPRHALIFSLICYLSVAFFSYANNYFPGGVDHSTHLFQTWLIKEYGLPDWNPFWYCGFPLLGQYPPISHLVSAGLALFFGVVDGYKLALAIGFVALPACFWFYLKEYKLSDIERSVAVLLFSFALVYIHYFGEGVFSALFGFNFAILYFKYLKRLFDRGAQIDAVLAAIFLSLTSLSHALNPIYCVLITVPYALFFGRSRLKETAIVMLLVALLSAWFWIPCLVNYKVASNSTGEISVQRIAGNALNLALDIGRSYVVSVNYVGIFFMLVFAPLLAYLILKGIAGKDRDNRRQALFLVSLVILVLGISLTPIDGFANTRRMLFFIPLLLAAFVAKGICSLKYRNVISALLIIPLVVLFFAYPIEKADIREDSFEMLSWVKGSEAQRFMVMPELFDMMPSNKSYDPVEEHRYATYMIPAYAGKEVVNGWWSIGAESVGKNPDLPDVFDLHCSEGKGIGRLLSEASWLNKNTLSVRKTCEPKLNSSVYCANIRESSLDYLIVNRNVPEVEEYVSGLECTKHITDYGNYAVYAVLGCKPYVGFSDSRTEYSYSKPYPGTVIVEYFSDGSGGTDLVVSETYMTHWKAYLDGREVAIERTSYGFMKLSLGEAKGKHTLKLEFKPERFNGLFTYVSAISWGAVLIFLASNKKR